MFLRFEDIMPVTVKTTVSPCEIVYNVLLSGQNTECSSGLIEECVSTYSWPAIRHCSNGSQQTILELATSQMAAGIAQSV